MWNFWLSISFYWARRFCRNLLSGQCYLIFLLKIWCITETDVPNLLFFVVKLKVVCLAVEKSGQFYLLGDIYNRIVFLKKSSGYDVVVKRKCYDRYPSETEHYWYSQYFCQSKTFHVHLLFFQKYIWSIKKKYNSNLGASIYILKWRKN